MFRGYSWLDVDTGQGNKKRELSSRQFQVSGFSDGTGGGIISQCRELNGINAHLLGKQRNVFYICWVWSSEQLQTEIWALQRITGIELWIWDSSESRWKSKSSTSKHVKYIKTTALGRVLENGNISEMSRKRGTREVRDVKRVFPWKPVEESFDWREMISSTHRWKTKTLKPDCPGFNSSSTIC